MFTRFCDFSIFSTWRPFARLLIKIINSIVFGNEFLIMKKSRPLTVLLSLSYTSFLSLAFGSVGITHVLQFHSLSMRLANEKSSKARGSECKKKGIFDLINWKNKNIVIFTLLLPSLSVSVCLVHRTLLGCVMNCWMCTGTPEHNREWTRELSLCIIGAFYLFSLIQISAPSLNIQNGLKNKLIIFSALIHDNINSAWAGMFYWLKPNSFAVERWRAGGGRAPARHF